MIVPVPQAKKNAAPAAQNGGYQNPSRPQGQNKNDSQKTGNRNVNMDQIIRVDGGKGHFVELTKQAISLHNKNAEGLLRLNFVSYDTNTRKQTDFVSFYLNFSEWDKMYHSVIVEEEEFAQKWAEALTGGNQYATILPTIFKGQNYNSQIVSRTLSIVPGQKEGILFFKATQGPGEQTHTGLIKPAGKSTASVGVPMKYEDLVAILMAGEKEIQAYKTAVACSSMGIEKSSTPVSAPVQSGVSNVDVAALEQKIDSLQGQVNQLISMVKTLTSMIE